jgi:uncharacterized membrane protein
MTQRRSLFWQIVIFSISLAYTLWQVSRMPETVPVHWGIDGKPDRFGSRWENVIFLPLMAALTIGLTLAGPRLMKPEQRDRGGLQTMYSLFVLVAAMMGSISALITAQTQQAATSGADQMVKAVMAVMFLFFAGMGNLMGKLRQNQWAGIRTPWTLKDEHVWEETHRRAAYLWFVGGICGALLSAFGSPLWASISLLLIMSFYPVVDSYRIASRRQ